LATLATLHEIFGAVKSFFEYFLKSGARGCFLPLLPRGSAGGHALHFSASQYFHHLAS